MDTVFKALNDPTRRKILQLLRKRDLTAGEIADSFPTSKPTISHHLDLLKQADLILAEKDGQYIVYSLNTSVLDDCIGWLLKLQGKEAQHEKTQRGMAATGDSRGALLRRRAALG